jgi:SET domain-containing protein
MGITFIQNASFNILLSVSYTVMSPDKCNLHITCREVSETAFRTIAVSHNREDCVKNTAVKRATTYWKMGVAQSTPGIN